MRRPAAAAPPLIVIGASVRAIAASAHRAGWHVHAADLYADADLRALSAATVQVRSDSDLPWPAGLVPAVADFPAAPWLYTGALENHPEIVDRLARDRPLAGNFGATLRAVRDPASLATVVREAGLGFPETFPDPAGLPVDGSFLTKPRASAGGRGIAPWRGGAAPAGERVWQRFVRGRPCSVAYAMQRGAARLFAASRQLVGRGWCGARGHAWCGAVDVPIESLVGTVRTRLDRLGTALADRFGLVGLVGVDLVVDPTGGMNVIEVNPRPTASLELVERATGASVAVTHVAACGFQAPPNQPQPAPRGRIWCKAVVFAQDAFRMDDSLATALARRADRWADADDGWPPLADVPAPGTLISAGGPALTVFAVDRSAAAGFATLRRRVAEVRRMLLAGGVSPPASVVRPLRPPGSTA